MIVSQRPSTRADETFVRQLILKSAEEELMAASWPEPMRSHLLEIQYSGRIQSLRSRFPGIVEKILLADGVRAGWFAKADLENEIRWLDLIVAVEWRGHGVGTAVLTSEIEEANRRRKPARFSVSVMNIGAIRLYERLGFRRIGGDVVNHEMEYLPERSSYSG
jgi:ribosomal protein S18 acetylase RimI-like enzyme